MCCGAEFENLMAGGATSQVFPATEAALLWLPLPELTHDNAVIGRVEVERGARLVCSVAGHSKTVLQMPRGNLEVIQPRPLALQLIADLLVSTAIRASGTHSLLGRRTLASTARPSCWRGGSG